MSGHTGHPDERRVPVGGWGATWSTPCCWRGGAPGQTSFACAGSLTAEELDLPRTSGAVRVAARAELILVVEDEEMVRRMAGRALVDAGYRVLEAESARQALDLLASATEPCKLVLVDVVMPGMGGRELASKIGELRPGLPTLFISGYTDGEILRRGLLEPDAAFLPKPFTAEALVRAVRDRLEGPAPAHAGGVSQGPAPDVGREGERVRGDVPASGDAGRPSLPLACGRVCRLTNRSA